MVYDLGSIGVALGVTAAFFFALTMFGMTTKFNMLKDKACYRCCRW